MVNEEKETGSTGAGHVERDGPRFPHADEIEIPEELSVEAVEPARRSERQPRGRLRQFGRGVAAGMGRVGAGVRGLVDRVLLAITFVVPLLILGYQSFEWLRTSGWPSVTLGQLLAVFGSTPGPGAGEDWSGLLDLLLGAPLAALLFAVGLCLHLLLALVLPSVRRD